MKEAKRVGVFVHYPDGEYVHLPDDKGLSPGDVVYLGEDEAGVVKCLYCEIQPMEGDGTIICPSCNETFVGSSTENFYVAEE